MIQGIKRNCFFSETISFNSLLYTKMAIYRYSFAVEYYLKTILLRWKNVNNVCLKLVRKSYSKWLYIRVYRHNRC